MLWASQVALLVKKMPAKAGDLRDVRLIPGLGRYPGGGHDNPLQYTFLENPLARGAWWVQSMGSQRVRHNLGFPGGSDGKESTCNAEDLGSIPGLRRCPGEGKDYPLWYSGLENSMDGIVHGVVTESDTAE